MLWTILILSLYSLGTSLSRTELNALVMRTAPQTGTKRKNTYIVKPTFLHKFKALEKLNTVPMRIISVNGQPVQNPFYSLNLPGCMAYEIATTAPQKTTQITEYLDKHTLEPVLMLLPNNKTIPEQTQTTLSRMNHATRRDLFKRLRLKQK